MIAALAMLMWKKGLSNCWFRLESESCETTKIDLKCWDQNVVLGTHRVEREEKRKEIK